MAAYRKLTFLIKTVKESHGTEEQKNICFRHIGGSNLGFYQYQVLSIYLPKLLVLALISCQSDGFTDKNPTDT